MIGEELMEHVHEEKNTDTITQYHNLTLDTPVPTQWLQTNHACLGELSSCVCVYLSLERKGCTALEQTLS